MAHKEISVEYYIKVYADVSCGPWLQVVQLGCSNWIAEGVRFFYLLKVVQPLSTWIFLIKTKWGKILAEAVKDAYSDIFTIKRDPTDSDIGIIAGKYKSTYNMPEKQADLCAHTFLALLGLCDKDVILAPQATR